MNAQLHAEVNILMIEDDASDAYLLSETMSEEVDNVEKTHFNITKAETLQDGIGKLDSSQYDAVLLDLNLADSSGVDTVKTIKESHPYIPVIVLTGVCESDLALETFHYGALDYICKGKLDGKNITNIINRAVHKNKSKLDFENSLKKLSSHAYERKSHLITPTDRAVLLENIENYISRSKQQGKMTAVFVLKNKKHNVTSLSKGKEFTKELIAAAQDKIKDRFTKSCYVDYIGKGQILSVFGYLNDETEIDEIKETIDYLFREKTDVLGEEYDLEIKYGYSVYPTLDQSEDLLQTAEDNLEK